MCGNFACICSHQLLPVRCCSRRKRVWPHELGPQAAISNRSFFVGDIGKPLAEPQGVRATLERQKTSGRRQFLFFLHTPFFCRRRGWGTLPCWGFLITAITRASIAPALLHHSPSRHHQTSPTFSRLNPICRYIFATPLPRGSDGTQSVWLGVASLISSELLQKEENRGFLLCVEHSKHN